MLGRGARRGHGRAEAHGDAVAAEAAPGYHERRAGDDRGVGRAVGGDGIDLRSVHVGGGRADAGDRQWRGEASPRVDQHHADVEVGARPIRRAERRPQPRQLLRRRGGEGDLHQFELVGEPGLGGRHRDRRIGRVRRQRLADRRPGEHRLLEERRDDVAEEDVAGERVRPVRADDVVQVGTERQGGDGVPAGVARRRSDRGPPLVAADPIEEDVDAVLLLGAGGHAVRGERREREAADRRRHAGRREVGGETPADDGADGRERIGGAHWRTIDPIRYAPAGAGAPMSRRLCSWFARSKTRSLTGPAVRCCRGTPRGRDRGAAPAGGPRVRRVREPSPPARRRGRCARGSAPAPPGHGDRRPIGRAIGAAWPASAGSGSIAVPAVVPAPDPPPARPLGPPRRRSAPVPASGSIGGPVTWSERPIRARPRPMSSSVTRTTGLAAAAARRLLAERPLLRERIGAGVGAAPCTATSAGGGAWLHGLRRDARRRRTLANRRGRCRGGRRSSAEARARAPVVERRPRPARGPRARSPGPPRSVPARGRATRAARRPPVRPGRAGTRSGDELQVGGAARRAPRASTSCSRQP